MSTIKAMQIKSRGRAEFIDCPVPVPGPGEALIRPLCFSLCGSDVYQLHFADEEDYPMNIGSTGHEVIGVVEEINGTHPEVSVGDMTLSLSPPQEAMAELFVTALNMVLPVPAGVPVEELVQAQQLGTVIYACQQLPNLVGQNVVVIGQGSAGLWFDHMIKRLGAARVIALDLLPHRLTLSRQMGASDVINNGSHDPVAALSDLLDGRLADVVVVAAGESSAINLAPDLVREYGFILQFGVPHEAEFTYRFRQMFRKNINLKAVVMASREPNHPSTRIALRMIADREIDVRPVVTHRFPFERVLEAYELQRTRADGAIKILVEMPDVPR